MTEASTSITTFALTRTPAFNDVVGCRTIEHLKLVDADMIDEASKEAGLKMVSSFGRDDSPTARMMVDTYSRVPLATTHTTSPTYPQVPKKILKTAIEELKSA